jgi:hypothetical protein
MSRRGEADPVQQQPALRLFFARFLTFLGL